MEKIKYLIFGIMLLAMTMPAVQKETGIFDIKPLKGAVSYAAPPEFTWQNWKSGEFQEKYDRYLEDHIGFRPFFVRLYNQIDYSLFGEIHARGVVEGKQGYLYERSYIEAYTGRDYTGDKHIRHKARLTALLQDTLMKTNTLLLPVFIPGKASFFPEFIPDEMLEPRGEQTNEQALKRTFDTLGVEYLDLSEWYLNLKGKTEYPLYPKLGIHWSDYGVSLVIDTLISYLGERSGRTMVSFDITSYEQPDTLRGDDYDLADGMNLLCRLPYYPMTYPRYHFHEGPDRFMPEVMTLADSYYWRLYAPGLMNRFFARNTFRYYNNVAYELGDANSYPVDHQHWFQQATEYDFVLIMFTEANLRHYAYDFLENGYIELMMEQRIREIMEAMRRSEEWMSSIREKAGKKNISVEEMMRADALWMIKQENKKETEE